METPLWLRSRDVVWSKRNPDISLLVSFSYHMIVLSQKQKVSTSLSILVFIE